MKMCFIKLFFSREMAFRVILLIIMTGVVFPAKKKQRVKTEFTLSGTVSYDNSERLKKVKVDIFNQDGKKIKSEKTNKSGEFEFKKLNSGEYILRLAHINHGQLDTLVQITNRDISLIISYPKFNEIPIDKMMTGIQDTSLNDDRVILNDTIKSKNVISPKRKNLDTLDVKHLIVDHNGNTKEGYVDSIGNQYLFYIPKDSVDLDSIKLKNIYYVYNDFDKVFHYSWSFAENVRRMKNRTGKAYTVNGDTVVFKGIVINKDMINPEILLKIGSQKSEYISMFDVERIETDFSIMSYSVKRGFEYSFYAFIIASTIDILTQWDKERRMAPQIWSQYNDLMPMISTIGLNSREGTGVTYESFTSLIPLSILISMGYDIFKQKNKFYFTPIYESKKFGRNMRVFSFKQLFKNQLKSIGFMMEKNKFGRKVLGWFR